MQGRLAPPLDLRGPDDPEGRRRHHLLLTHWGEPSEVLAGSCDGAEARERRTNRTRGDPTSRLEVEAQWMRENGVRYWIPDTVSNLSRLGTYAPRLLFLRGDIVPSAPAVAIVGTRHPDEYGTEVARRLGRALARAGVTVVSGGALGVDGLAHEAALDAGGRTIVVFGSGLARLHPSSLAPLFERVARSGSALVSEYPVYAPPSRRHFPERNRLIAAQSDAVVVVQAGEGSGALITAGWARRLGVPLFAVPADLWYHASTGALSLLREGARPLTHPADLAEVPELASLTVSPIDWPKPGHRPWGMTNPWAATEEPTSPPTTGLPTDETCSEVSDSHPILAVLCRGPADLDALVAATGLPSGRLQAELTALEVTGHIRRLPGGTWTSSRKT